MKFFIGIVPPEDIYNTIVTIQKRFGDNRLEPHITLRPPVAVEDETNWTKVIEQVCSGFAPFLIDLSSTGHFGQRVLFIDVSSDALHQLHHSLIKAIKPYEQPEIKKQEAQIFNPHLTLGRSWCGFTRQDFAEMKVIADCFLSQKNISFTANSIRIYHKPSGTGRYAPKTDIALSGAIQFKT
jgi:2'-5' RNA ligase